MGLIKKIKEGILELKFSIEAENLVGKCEGVFDGTNDGFYFNHWKWGGVHRGCARKLAKFVLKEYPHVNEIYLMAYTMILNERSACVTKYSGGPYASGILLFKSPEAVLHNADEEMKNKILPAIIHTLVEKFNLSKTQIKSELYEFYEIAAKK